jgi:gluconate 2-dehydrogenase subunit 3-like protein
MDGVSRRNFLGAGGAVALVPIGAEAATKSPPGEAARTGAPGPARGADARARYLFFNAAEAAFIEAAIDRLIPPDAFGPSATQADVHRYLDLQLHGAWGGRAALSRGAMARGHAVAGLPAAVHAGRAVPHGAARHPRRSGARRRARVRAARRRGAGPLPHAAADHGARPRGRAVERVLRIAARHDRRGLLQRPRIRRQQGHGRLAHDRIPRGVRELLRARRPPERALRRRAPQPRRRRGRPRARDAGPARLDQAGAAPARRTRPAPAAGTPSIPDRAPAAPATHGAHAHPASHAVKE